ncbi:holin [Streptomyces sp. WMMC897]|uniref:holin n=1 Tax=Streptomyces sp. WMMC897 TaxID=3014782 RepID=UPI0022B741E6|nr:holin [Streptomyces sp. WMMC897]MCZ7413031.1 holin [Streptomyces sp. WMMC897]MCZ7413087.1 holin [Streptomyces sp. WMMC897]MCZ7415441.1 holin [Streptomyces sp. WMMC897]
MNTSAFWIATLERTVRTFAQALLAVVGADGLGVTDVDWGATLSVAGLAALAAVLTAVATSGGTHGPGVTETVRRSGP